MMKVFVVFCILLSSISSALAQSYAIGVLAYNGKERAVKRWQPTADYLTQQIPDAQFKVVPLTLEECVNAIHKQELAFILTNPGHYVRLEVQFGITRIATFLNKYQQQTLKHFSATIFTRQDNHIESLDELKGRSFAAVSEDAFGGFQLAQLALKEQGIDALEELEIKWFGFPHADIVKAVMDGRADAGVVRSGVIEKMASTQTVDLSQIKVLQPKQTQGYPFMHSVGLYPEWPFSKLPNTDTRLSKAVAISLLKMYENDQAALSSGGSGWTIPLTYSSIHAVLRQLQVEPYTPRPMEIASFWQSYQQWIIALGLLFLLIIIMLMRLIQTNRALKSSQQAIQSYQGELEETVQHRTDELLQINETLQIEIASHVQTEKTLREGCESLKSLYSVLSRTDLDREQKLNSMLDSVRQYLGLEIALLSKFSDGQCEVCSLIPSNAKIPVPLSKTLSQQSIEEHQIITRENVDNFRSYIVCPVFIDRSVYCILEFANFAQSQSEMIEMKDRYSSDLSMNILSLVSQWIGNETLLLENEKQSQKQHKDIKSRFEGLSPRETEVLQLLTQGESTKQMARILGISSKTVEMHRANLLKKTNAKSSTELVQLSVISGIYSDT